MARFAVRVLPAATTGEDSPGVAVLSVDGRRRRRNERGACARDGTLVPGPRWCRELRRRGSLTPVSGRGRARPRRASPRAEPRQGWPEEPAAAAEKGAAEAPATAASGSKRRRSKSVLPQPVLPRPVVSRPMGPLTIPWYCRPMLTVLRTARLCNADRGEEPRRRFPEQRDSSPKPVSRPVLPSSLWVLVWLTPWPVRAPSARPRGTARSCSVRASRRRLG